MIDREVGDAEIEKSGFATVRVALTECVSEPLVPVMVRLNVPAAAVITRVELPEPVTDPGVKTAVAPEVRIEFATANKPAH